MLMPKEICCINFKGLFAYLNKYYRENDIKLVLDGLVNNPEYLIHDLKDPSSIFPIRREHLTEPDYWVSNDFSLKLFQNVKKIVKDPNPLYEAGRGAVRESLSKSALFIGRVFGPSFLAKQAAKINSRFNKTKQVLPSLVNGQTLKFQLIYYPRVKITKDVCNWNLGIYYELMNMTGVAGVKAEEIRCVLDGDACCEFSLSWNKSKTFQNIFTGISIWPVKKDVKEAIAEYEATLEQRDTLIEELISSEEKHRSVFENTATANAIIESDTSILSVNSEFEKLIGYSKKEIEQKMTLKSFISKQQHYIFEDYLGIKCDQIPCPTSNIELSLHNRDGSQKKVLCKMGRIPKTSQFVVSLMDISDYKRAQKEKEQLEMKLVKAEKMEAVGALAGGVAHDLNNILSGIVSYPDLLLLQLPDDSPHRNAIKTIQESGKKAAAIVQDMLTMARRGVLIKEAINLNRIVSEYLESPECEKLKSFHPDVEIQFRSENNLMNMLGSPLHTAKAVMNLVSNAAEAMPSGGDVIITTRNVSFKVPHKGYEVIPEGNYVCLSVEDNGVGILPEDIDHIFEPFYTKKKMGRSGTGLGMAVVWGTVKDQKGYVDINSIIDKGTHFKLYFPVSTDEAIVKVTTEPVEILKGNGESILVVDDVNEQLEIAGNILVELGYKVNTAQSGEKALEFLESHSVDLVILDMIMDPGIDGQETYRRINQLNPSQKVIIASGFSDSIRVKEIQNTGAGSYIRKPYSIETISKVVYQELKKPSPSQSLSAF